MQKTIILNRLQNSRINLLSLMDIIAQIAMILVGAHILPEMWTALVIFSLTTFITAFKGSGINTDPWILVAGTLGALINIGNYIVENNLFADDVMGVINIVLSIIVILFRSLGTPVNGPAGEAEWKRSGSKSLK